MRHKTTQTVFSYFNRIRNGKSVPLRADINPAELKSVLPDVFLLEIARDAGLVFRLAGTRVCSIMGRELRGENFGELWQAASRHKMKLAAEAVLANQMPLAVTVRSTAIDENDGDLDMLLMPLASRPGACDRLFGCLVDLSSPALQLERLRTLSARDLHFVSTNIDCLDRGIAVGDGETLSVATSQAATLRARIMHLRVLAGGRKD